MIYLDSSALVKRYIEEEGGDKVNALLEAGSIAAVSRLAYA
jgi:predicted nucleic acid-binding protein